jgi:hypothetical protein
VSMPGASASTRAQNSEDGLDVAVVIAPGVPALAENKTWLELSLTAADLLTWAQALCFTGDLARCEPATFRYRISADPHSRPTTTPTQRFLAKTRPHNNLKPDPQPHARSRLMLAIQSRVGNASSTVSMHSVNPAAGSLSGRSGAVTRAPPASRTGLSLSQHQLPCAPPCSRRMSFTTHPYACVGLTSRSSRLNARGASRFS